MYSHFACNILSVCHELHVTYPYVSCPAWKTKHIWFPFFAVDCCLQIKSMNKFSMCVFIYIQALISIIFILLLNNNKYSSASFKQYYVFVLISVILIHAVTILGLLCLDQFGQRPVLFKFFVSCVQVFFFCLVDEARFFFAGNLVCILSRCI